MKSNDSANNGMNIGKHRERYKFRARDRGRHPSVFGVPAILLGITDTRSAA